MHSINCANYMIENVLLFFKPPLKKSCKNPLLVRLPLGVSREFISAWADHDCRVKGKAWALKQNICHAQEDLSTL